MSVQIIHVVTMVHVKMRSLTLSVIVWENGRDALVHQLLLIVTQILAKMTAHVLTREINSTVDAKQGGLEELAEFVSIIMC